MLLRRKLLLSGMVVFVLLCSFLVVSAVASSGWSQTYGGTEDELALSVIATSDGGYALTGWVRYSGAGGSDFWLVKTDSNGAMEWNRTYGGAKSDEAHSLVETADGGYAIAGFTSGAEYRNFWLVKTDANGIMEWNRAYNETNDDGAFSLVATADGGYALAGWTVALGPEAYDFWLVKTDALGNMEWNRTYGEGTVTSLIATSDGGYALAGAANSSDGSSTDFYLAKTGSFGNMEWNKTYGGTGDDMALSLVATSDGGYALAGASDYVSAIFAYHGDSWLVKTDTLEVIAASSSPGSKFWLVKTDAAGNMQWNKTYSVTGFDIAVSLAATSDGGYALCGSTSMVKTDEFGNLLWNKTFESGATYQTYASSLIATSDDGYALAGHISYALSLDTDFWLAKTDEFGVYPEYSSWLIPSLVLTATAFIINNKKRLLRARSQKP
jgi:hypothetical protein